MKTTDEMIEEILGPPADRSAYRELRISPWSTHSYVAKVGFDDGRESQWDEGAGPTWQQALRSLCEVLRRKT